MYVPLYCKTSGSFLEGASHPGELVERAAELGLPALAVTDRDGVYGAVQAHVAAKAAGLPLVLGAEVTARDGSPLVLLAADREGWANLCRLLTRALGPCAAPGRPPPADLRASAPGLPDPGAPDPEAPPRRPGAGKVRRPLDWAEVAAHAGGLLALWGGARSALAAAADPALAAGLLKDAFGDRLYAMVARHRSDAEVDPERRLRERAGRFGLPVVAATEVLYHDASRRDLQDVLTCIRHNVPLAAAGRRTRPNDLHALWPADRFAALFADDPAAVARTREVAARCAFRLDDLRYRYPLERLPEGLTTGAHLRALVLEGAAGRYGGPVPADVQAQLDKELLLIDELDYGGYFLTMHEIVRWARLRGILCQGRGSAANSAVCYCLGITAVDPVRMGLLFERFLSRERAEPPDIDLDIAHGRREEVIQHVYEAYGRDRAAMVANVVRYRPRGALRDVGKALGMPGTALDRLARLAGWYDLPGDDAYRAAGLDPTEGAGAHLKRLVAAIQRFPRHLSIHPGGFLLGHEPVHRIVPIEDASMEGRTVIQWDKDDVEALGLFKVDLLGLGALTHLDLCFDLLKRHRAVDLALATIPPEDPATYRMLCRGDTAGVFQLESRAQMATLPRLQPRTWYDLVVEISIVRPGPIAGQMFHPYLRRRQGLEPVDYPHPSLEPVLAKTLGVPLFQEQVMRLAVVAADYTPGEADQLRRDMAAWRREGRIGQHHDRLVTRMVAKGIAPEFAERVFQQIQGFGEYGFPESHAASFALLCYATAWLRCHCLPEFTAALLNAQPMGFYSVSTLVQDAMRHGLQVRPVDVRLSDWDCTLEEADDGTRPPGAAPGAPAHPFAVRMGLRFVKGLGAAHRDRIADAAAAGPFASLQDFARRTRLPADALSALARAGAFEGFDASRRGSLWEARGLGAAVRDPLDLPVPSAPPAFDPLSPAAVVRWDHQAAGHSPRGHPLAHLRPALRARGLPDAATLNALPDGRQVRYAGLVICRQRPVNAHGVTFMTLEDETGFVNVVLWEDVQEAHRVLVRTATFLGISGRLQVRDGVAHLVARSCFAPDLAPAAAVESRDYR